jgi:hypothetical protein
MMNRDETAGQLKRHWLHPCVNDGLFLAMTGAGIPTNPDIYHSLKKN